jgi:hypothetical protein
VALTAWYVVVLGSHRGDNTSMTTGTTSIVVRKAMMTPRPVIIHLRKLPVTNAWANVGMRATVPSVEKECDIVKTRPEVSVATTFNWCSPGANEDMTSFSDVHNG